MDNTTAHIVAMTGSYFRGDSVPVLTPEDEAKFDKVSFNYYEQLNGYSYLKSLALVITSIKAATLQKMMKGLSQLLKF
nr:hypothetical protein [Acinetobacter baumannii]